MGEGQLKEDKTVLGIAEVVGSCAPLAHQIEGRRAVAWIWPPFRPCGACLGASGRTILGGRQPWE